MTLHSQKHAIPSDIAEAVPARDYGRIGDIVYELRFRFGMSYHAVRETFCRHGGITESEFEQLMYACDEHEGEGLN